MASIRPVNVRGRVRWMVDYKALGKRIRRTFANEADAQAFFHTVRGDVIPALAVGELLSKYAAATVGQRATNSHLGLLQRLENCYRVCQELSVQHAYQLATDETAGRFLLRLRERADWSEYTVAGHMAVMRAVVRWASWKQFLPALSERGWKVPTPEKVKKRFLRKDEIEWLMTVAAGYKPSLLPPIALGVYQGLRRGEIIALRPSDLVLADDVFGFKPKGDALTLSGDRPGGLLTVQKSKTKNWRTIALHPKIMEWAQAAMGRVSHPIGEGQEFVCLTESGAPWQPTSLSQAFKRLVRRHLGWDDVTLHTLRHTCASHMAMAGHTLYQVAQFLGHSHTGTTELYAHLSPDSVCPTW